MERPRPRHRARSHDRSASGRYGTVLSDTGRASGTLGLDQDRNIHRNRPPTDGLLARRRSLFGRARRADDLGELHQRFGGMDLGWPRRNLDMPPGLPLPAGLFDTPRAPTAECGVPGYELVKKLKTGGMSEVVNIVKDRVNGELFVEKRFRADGGRLGRTTAELNALMRIQRGQNLNFMVTYLWGYGNINCTFILEYCDKGNLAEQIQKYRAQRRGISEDFAWHVLLSISQALAFLHQGIKNGAVEQGPKRDWNTLCHLDIKPCNIFLSTADQAGPYPLVVLGDFGCAITKSDIVFGMEHPRQQAAGTPQWLLDIPDRDRLATERPAGRSYSKLLNATIQVTTTPDWRKRYTAAKLIKTMKSEREYGRRNEERYGTTPGSRGRYRYLD
ncbi:hypothetical protein LTR37_014067 [Vermiconidia calcicola]|uniref:Uncharacterized protein n=1 Tax=Vermiconidia calcicola TaxID=1690605 RepID=A0ACC3MUY8_9PEZI|nr:hypothetical protein LTR37_014067 [Vermiconidia calcicola]